MDKQATLFPRWNADQLTPTDPNAAEEDKPRLSGQCAAILERLRQGPVTNHEIADMRIDGRRVLKHTSRLSDLRKHGYTIDAKRQSGGVWVYTLKE